MKRGAAKRVWSWIVFLAVVSIFFSTNVYDVMALESEQVETSDVELLQEDFSDGAAEASDADLTQPDVDFSQIEEENSKEVNSSAGAETEEIEEVEKIEEAEEIEETEETEKIEEAGEIEETEKTEDFGETDEISENGGAGPDAEIISTEPVYMLYITHTLLYTRDGKERYIQETSQVQLKQEDFEDGLYSLMNQAYDWDAVTASPEPGYPELISMEEFWEDGEGGKEYCAEIRYTVKEGWEVRFHQEGDFDGAVLYSMYEGAFDNIEFIPVRSITLTIYYKYSNTGGLAGIDAHAPDEIVLPLNEDGTADLENWRVPHEDNNSNLEGFRIVLNPEPLNQFLVKPDAAEDPFAHPGSLENGDFNLRSDVDITSPEYQAAWDAARTTTVNGVTFTYIAPTTNGGTEATTSDDADKQYTLNASGLTEDLTLIIYYRRAMGTYTVNYWLRGANDDGSDQQIGNSIKVSGRIGALTNVKHLDPIPEGYLPESIAQETIAADGSTVVNVYYSADQIRVIFDTDYIYIPRQQVAAGGYVDFSGISEEDMNAARAGYKFCGWQYEDKNGDRHDIQLTDDNKLWLSIEFLEKANVTGSQETDNVSIQVLNLYPKWEEDTTTVRVIFWTEDLNGDDVKVTDSFYDFNEEKDNDIVRSEYAEIRHQRYNDPGASYTNAGSFAINNIKTNTALVGSDGKLISEIQDEVKRQLESSLMGTTKIAWGNNTRVVENSDFYDQQGFTVLGEGEDGLLAAADGSTMVNIFFERREYTLDFVYYFVPKQTGGKGTCIATRTEDFYNGIYHWPEDESKDCPDVSAANELTTISLKDEKIPRRTVITAKYGADLRSIWPGAEDVSDDNSTRYVVNGMTRISWSTTAGIHNEIGYGGNKNVPGAYSTMSAAIVADTENNSKVHHLVAFWREVQNSYRYNHCYEVPELDPEWVKKTGLQVNIFEGPDNPDYTAGMSDEEKKIKNTLYLVPVTDQTFLKYGFSDLLTYKDLALPVNANISAPIKNKEDYYVIRIYNNKCYAVSRQLVALSAQHIGAQNPNTRPNLTLVNTNEQDHSTELHNRNGSGTAGGYKTPDNPYDIYFYYTREEFTITYMSNDISIGTTEIGKITLPYGARLYESQYNIPLDYTKTAGYYASERNGYAAWSTKVRDADNKEVDSHDFPVCPGRSENDTRAWEFGGWYLAPSGERPMEWENEIEGNLLLYVKWEDPSYIVKFDWNGGSISSSDEEIDESQLQSQRVPANQFFVKNGHIPRPVREGYILSGWQITHKGRVDGSDIEWISTAGTDGSFPEFHFDDPVTSDLKVQAVWTPSGRAEISYTVYYLDKETEVPVAKEKVVTGNYPVGTVVWERPAVPEDGPYRNYVPLEQNKSIILDMVDDNQLIFYYVAPSNYLYQVKFVEKGTNKEILSYDYTTRKVSLLVHPEKEQVNELDELGYWVVNDEGKPEENGASLGKTIQPGVEENPVAVFYVLPREYEICYTNLEVMGEAAERELRELNPASYTSRDPNLPRTLKNPEGTYLFNGNGYRFMGWRMDQTKEIGTVVGEIPDFGDSEIAKTVTIQPGSRGRLIFQAVWTQESYVVYFYSGDCGFFPNHESVIDFGGLTSNTLLVGKIMVPTVIPNEDSTFIGWRWEEGADSTRLYTEEEVLAMSVENQDMHFTACYRVVHKSDPAELKEQDVPKEIDNFEGASNSGSLDSSSGLNDYESPGVQSLPQTGMNWISAWMLGALGIIFLSVGIWKEKKRGEKG